jgi:hypothetical protein
MPGINGFPSTIDLSATDDSTINVTAGNKLQIKDLGVSEGKIAAAAVTAAKLGVLFRTPFIFSHTYHELVSGTLTFSLNPNSLFSLNTESNNTNTLQVNYYVYLPAGTYTFKILCRTGPSNCILNLKIDDVSVGTVDTYGANVFNNVLTITGIAVAANGLKKISLTNPTKHASATNYYLEFVGFWFVKTA